MIIQRPRFAVVACALAPMLLAACSDGGVMGLKAPAFQRTEEPCKDTSFPIYFDRGSDQLTADAHALILTIGGHVKACAVRSAEVVGLADAGGGSDRGDADLSRRRADSVARALSDAGLPIPKSDVTSQNVTPTARPGQTDPLHRRTEVILHVGPVTPRS